MSFLETGYTMEYLSDRDRFLVGHDTDFMRKYFVKCANLDHDDYLKLCIHMTKENIGAGNTNVQSMLHMVVDWLEEHYKNFDIHVTVALL